MGDGAVRPDAGRRWPLHLRCRRRRPEQWLRTGRLRGLVRRPAVPRQIDVTIIAEPSSRISALEAGDVDMLDIVPAIGVAQLQDNPDLTLVQSPGTSWLGLAMNYARPPWDNPEARMAVAKAIDREDLIEKAFFGSGDARRSARSPPPSPGPTSRRTRPKPRRRSISTRPRRWPRAPASTARNRRSCAHRTSSGPPKSSATS